MAAPIRGILGTSSTGTNPGNISWPVATSSSFSWGGTTCTTSSSSTLSCARESISQSSSERKIRGVSGAVESSSGVSTSAKAPRSFSGNNPLERSFGAFGDPSASSKPSQLCRSRGISVLRLAAHVEDLAHACTSSQTPVSSGCGVPVETASSSGAFPCRSVHGGLLALPPLTHRSRTSSRGAARRIKYVGSTGAGGPVRALGRGGQDLVDKGKDMAETGDLQALEGKWHAELSQSSQSGDSEASWEQIGMVFRVVYALAMYGGLAFAGHVICSFTGVNLWGGFDLSPEVIMTGFGYAVPPMMALLFILEDEIVKTWGPARAIRDVEDEELMDFFVGMSPWQFPFVVAAGAVAEELFFRAAIQGGLAHALQISDKGVTDTTVGLAALTGVIPLFVPFAQLFAAALTAALTGSMYYVISSPKDPKYVVAPVVRGHNNRRDIKERVEAWYERRQQKKIYSPLMEGLLALYLGFEWMHAGNILAPMITHTLYSLVIVGNGLRRIHGNREKLRQRVNKIAGQRVASVGVKESGYENSS